MKHNPVACLAFILFIAPLWTSAREAALQYKFSEGQTNVFAVEIVAHSENGAETNTGNVILVTTGAATNSASLACGGNFKSSTHRESPGSGFFPGYFPGIMSRMETIFPYNCEIQLDSQGNETRDTGDYVMAAPLGKLVQCLFTPLPEKGANSESRDMVAVLDNPFWLGPSQNFLNIRQNGQPMYMGFYMPGQRNSPATLSVAREIKTRMDHTSADHVDIAQVSTFQSLARYGNEPRLQASSETKMTFDRNLGMLSHIEIQADVTSQTESSSRHAKVSFKARLLVGDELAAALAPPPPPAPPRKLSDSEISSIEDDLKSPDIDTRHGAVRRLNGVDIAAPSPEIMEAIGGFAFDTDVFVRMTAATFISNHATTNEVPLLIKFLKGSDWSVRQPAIKALGRLNDERAAQPLADMIARNGSMFSQDISSALINLGPRAEKAVLGLLNDHNLETKRQACTILQQIGTDASVDPLQKLVADDDQTLSQAAADAIRGIKQRE